MLSLLGPMVFLYIGLFLMSFIVLFVLFKKNGGSVKFFNLLFWHLGASLIGGIVGSFLGKISQGILPIFIQNLDLYLSFVLYVWFLYTFTDHILVDKNKRKKIIGIFVIVTLILGGLVSYFEVKYYSNFLNNEVIEDISILKKEVNEVKEILDSDNIGFTSYTLNNTDSNESNESNESKKTEILDNLYTYTKEISSNSIRSKIFIKLKQIEKSNDKEFITTQIVDIQLLLLDEGKNYEKILIELDALLLYI